MWRYLTESSMKQVGCVSGARRWFRFIPDSATYHPEH